MAEANEAKKQKAEVTEVKMEDGRTVGFAGNRKLMKETVIDESKIALDGDTITLSEGAVRVRLNFRNGKVIVHTPKSALVPKYIGHGGEQKLGDETAGETEIEDMFMAVETLSDRLHAAEGLSGWNVTRESGGFAGASIVVRAIMEVTGKVQDEVKAFLQKKLDDAEKRGEKLSRKALYDAFRNPSSKVGQIVKRMEDEKLSKASAIDADAALAEMG